MARKKPDRFVMTDNMGLVHMDGKTFKAISYRGPRVTYAEIDVADYDARVEALVAAILAAPGVNLVDVLKDALYDIPLERFEVVERMIHEEAVRAKTEKRPPNMATTKRDRGTCVNLAVAGRFCAVLRE